MNCQLQIALFNCNALTPEDARATSEEQRHRPELESFGGKVQQAAHSVEGALEGRQREIEVDQPPYTTTSGTVNRHRVATSRTHRHEQCVKPLSVAV